jgi:hypothetical protein
VLLVDPAAHPVVLLVDTVVLLVDTVVLLVDTVDVDPESSHLRDQVVGRVGVGAGGHLLDDNLDAEIGREEATDAAATDPVRFDDPDVRAEL